MNIFFNYSSLIGVIMNDESILYNAGFEVVTTGENKATRCLKS